MWRNWNAHTFLVEILVFLVVFSEPEYSLAIQQVGIYAGIKKISPSDKGVLHDCCYQLSSERLR